MRWRLYFTSLRGRPVTLVLLLLFFVTLLIVPQKSFAQVEIKAKKKTGVSSSEKDRKKDKGKLQNQHDESEKKNEAGETEGIRNLQKIVLAGRLKAEGEGFLFVAEGTPSLKDGVIEPVFGGHGVIFEIRKPYPMDLSKYVESDIRIEARIVEGEPVIIDEGKQALTTPQGRAIYRKIVETVFPVSLVIEKIY